MSFHLIVLSPLQGERGTWEKLAAIRANCGIELTIDACLAKLTNEVKNQRVLQSRTSRSSLRPGQGQAFLRARTPSWINLQAYGELIVNALDISCSASPPTGQLSWLYEY